MTLAELRRSNPMTRSLRAPCAIAGSVSPPREGIMIIETSDRWISPSEDAVERRVENRDADVENVGFGRSRIPRRPRDRAARSARRPRGIRVPGVIALTVPLTGSSSAGKSATVANSARAANIAVR